MITINYIENPTNHTIQVFDNGIKVFHQLIKLNENTSLKYYDFYDKNEFSVVEYVDGKKNKTVLEIKTTQVYSLIHFINDN